jgi:hypothetical protein
MQTYRSTALVRAGGTFVIIAGMPTVRPKDGRAIFFVVESDRSMLVELAQHLRDGRLRPIVGAVRPLAQTPAAFARDRRTLGQTIIRIAEDDWPVFRDRAAGPIAPSGIAPRGSWYRSLPPQQPPTAKQTGIPSARAEVAVDSL